MGKLDVSLLRYMAPEDFRVLIAIEMGMKNHEVVPVNLIHSIAKLHTGGCFKTLRNLTKHRFICYFKDKKTDGYYLNYKGYDFLALQTLIKQGHVSYFGSQIGVGKESDVYVVSNDDGKKFAIKIHRLGRNSFRKLKEKRDYHRHRQSPNWLYLSRLAATKEFTFMQALYARNFPVPKPIAHNRHCIVMQVMADYVPLTQILGKSEELPDSHIDGTDLKIINDKTSDPSALYAKLMDLVYKMALCGIIHGDFNEFNLMFNPNDISDIVVIDFPQVISMHHPNAKEYFDRDVQGIVTFMKRRFNLTFDDFLDFQTVFNEFIEKTHEITEENSNLHVSESRLNKDALITEVTDSNEIKFPKTTEEYSILDRFLYDTAQNRQNTHSNRAEYEDSFSENEDSEINDEDPIFEISKKFQGMLDKSLDHKQTNTCNNAISTEGNETIDKLGDNKKELIQARFDMCKHGKDRIAVNVKTHVSNEVGEALITNSSENLYDGSVQQCMGESASTNLSTVMDENAIRAKIRREAKAKENQRGNLSKQKGVAKLKQSNMIHIKEEKLALH